MRKERGEMTMKTKIAAILAALVVLMFFGTAAYAQGPTPTPDWVELLRETVIPEIREAQDALATSTPTPVPPTATPVPTQVPPASGPVEPETKPQGPAQPQQPERPGIVERIFGGIAGFFGRRVIDPAGDFVARFKWVLIAIVVLVVIGILTWVFRGIQWLIWAISQLRHVWTLLKWLAGATGSLIRFISEARARRTEPRRPDEYEVTLAPPSPLAPTEVVHPNEGDLDVPGWTPPGRRPRTGVIDENDLPPWLRRGTPLEERKEDQNPPGWFTRSQKDLWWRLVRLGWLDDMGYQALVEYVKNQTPAEPTPRRGVEQLLNFLRDGHEDEEEQEGQEGNDNDKVQKLIDFLRR